MAVGAALIPTGVRQSFSVGGEQTAEQHRGNALLAGGMTMVVFGFSGVLGSAIGLSAANKKRRHLERSLRP
jgi:hypothetical protein